MLTKSKSLALQILQLRRKGENGAAKKLVDEYVQGRRSEGKNPEWVRRGIEASITKLEYGTDSLAQAGWGHKTARKIAKKLVDDYGPESAHAISILIVRTIKDEEL